MNPTITDGEIVKSSNFQLNDNRYTREEASERTRGYNGVLELGNSTYELGLVCHFRTWVRTINLDCR